MIKIYFYRMVQPGNVLMKWEGAHGTPRVGELVLLHPGSDGTYMVNTVRWCPPQLTDTQAVDIYLTGPVRTDSLTV